MIEKGIKLFEKGKFMPPFMRLGIFIDKITIQICYARQARQRKSSSLLLSQRGPLGECGKSLPRLLADFETAVVREWKMKEGNQNNGF